MKRIQLILSLVYFTMQVMAQTPSPGEKNDQRILIRYATAHLGTGEVIENAYIEIQNGEISRVSNANTARINTADYDTIIDAQGKHVYPGFIAMDSRLGLTEIDAVKATRDYDETGDFNPNVRALPAFNTESTIISTVRTNGVLMAQIAPVGGVISGSSSMVHFDGWDWQDASIRADEGIYMHWPKRYQRTGWWAEPGVVKTNKKYTEQVEEINVFFDQSRAYVDLGDPIPSNLKLEAMRGVLDGSARLYVRAEYARDILDVVQFVRRHKLASVTIVGGAEAHLVSTELRENNISVIIDRVHQLPMHPDSPIDEPFTLASTLVSAGVMVAFATSGSMEAMISRNLPFQAGTAVHYGLDYEAAIQCLTLNAAIIAGIDNRYGSLEPGKSATLFISSGDALDMVSNSVVMIFIEGKRVSLENHQHQLYEKFSKKYGIAP